MISASRKQVRKAFAAILQAQLTAAQAVYSYRVGQSMAGQSPVAVVTSAGTRREPFTFQGTIPGYLLAVFFFVAYPKEGDSWTEDQTDDWADDLEEALGAIVAANQKGTYWEAITQAGDSEVSIVTIGGIEYLWEKVTLRFE